MCSQEVPSGVGAEINQWVGGEEVWREDLWDPLEMEAGGVVEAVTEMGISDWIWRNRRKGKDLQLDYLLP